MSMKWINFPYMESRLICPGLTPTGPTKKGSIDYRWQASPPIGFNFTPPSRVEAHMMTRDQLMTLSPAEKYDLLMGRYEYPLFNEVRKLPSVNNHAEEWDGICDGWSMASTQFAEPKPVDQVSADGIVIPFGSSDVKAILSYAMSYHFDTMDDAQAGEPCEQGVCAGINAGTFHIALTNQIGLQKQALIMDRSTTVEIWNQPIFAYSLQIVGSARPDIGVRGVHVKGVIIYSDELNAPLFSSGPPEPQTRSRGAWISIIRSISTKPVVYYRRSVSAKISSSRFYLVCEKSISVYWIFRSA